MITEEEEDDEEEQNKINARIKAIISKINRHKTPVDETVIENLTKIHSLAKHFPKSIDPAQMADLAALLSSSRKTKFFEEASALLFDIFISHLSADLPKERKEAAVIALLQSISTFEALLSSVNLPFNRKKAFAILTLMATFCKEKLQEHCARRDDFSFLSLLSQDEAKVDAELKGQILRFSSFLTENNAKIQLKYRETPQFLSFFNNRVLNGVETKNVVYGDVEVHVYAVLTFYHAFFDFRSIDFADNPTADDDTDNAGPNHPSRLFSLKGFFLFEKAFTATMRKLDAVSLAVATANDENVDSIASNLPALLASFNAPLSFLKHCFDHPAIKTYFEQQSNAKTYFNVLAMLFSFISRLISMAKTAHFSRKPENSAILAENAPKTEKTQNCAENPLLISATTISAVLWNAAAAFSLILWRSDKAKAALVKMRITSGADEDQSGLVFVLCSMLETSDGVSITARAMENVLIAFFRGNRVGQNLCGITLKMASKHGNKAGDNGNGRQNISFGDVMLMVVKKCDNMPSEAFSRELVHVVRLFSVILCDNEEVKTSLLTVDTGVGSRMFLPRLLFRLLVEEEKDECGGSGFVGNGKGNGGFELKVALAQLFSVWFSGSAKAIRVLFKSPQKFFPKLAKFAVSLYNDADPGGEEEKCGDENTKNANGNKNDKNDTKNDENGHFGNAAEKKKEQISQKVSLREEIAFLLFIVSTECTDLALPPTALGPPLEYKPNESLSLVQRVLRDFAKIDLVKKDIAEKRKRLALRNETNAFGSLFAFADENNDFGSSGQSLYDAFYSEFFTVKTAGFDQKLEKIANGGVFNKPESDGPAPAAEIDETENQSFQRNVDDNKNNKNIPTAAAAVAASDRNGVASAETDKSPFENKKELLVLLNKQREKLKEFSAENKRLVEANVRLQKTVQKHNRSEKPEKQRTCDTCADYQKEIEDLLFLADQQETELELLRQNGEIK